MIFSHPLLFLALFTWLTSSETNLRHEKLWETMAIQKEPALFFKDVSIKNLWVLKPLNDLSFRPGWKNDPLKISSQTGPWTNVDVFVDRPRWRTWLDHLYPLDAAQGTTMWPRKCAPPVRDMGWSHQIQLHVILQAWKIIETMHSKPWNMNSIEFIFHQWLKCMINDPNVQWSIKKVSLKLFKSPLKTTHANFGLEKDPCKGPMTYLKQSDHFPKPLGIILVSQSKAAWNCQPKKKLFSQSQVLNVVSNHFFALWASHDPCMFFPVFFPFVFSPSTGFLFDVFRVTSCTVHGVFQPPRGRRSTWEVETLVAS